MKLIAAIGAIHPYSDLISAFSALIICIFTGVLIRVGSQQAKLTRDALGITERAFAADHRPRIILRDVDVVDGEILYILVNTGSGKGTIVESWIMTEWLYDDTKIRNLRSNEHNDLGCISFVPGQFHDLTYPPIDCVKDFLRRERNNCRPPVNDKPPAEILHFAGTIVYEDASGNRRRSVFRRKWDRHRLGFYRLDDNDHEYTE